MSTDPNWLAAGEWKWAQDHLPIACVDVVPVQRGPGGAVSRVGLIARGTPHQGVGKWCIVGGRLWRNESFAQAITRQVRETLGPAVQFEVPPHPQPDTVAEYFPDLRPGMLLDPRQHAVTFVFVVAIEGAIQPGGEADDFRWFDPADLPPAVDFGFGQDAIVRRCLVR